MPDSRDFHFYTALYHQTVAMERVSGDAKLRETDLVEAEKAMQNTQRMSSSDIDTLRLRQHLLKYATASEKEQKATVEYLRSQFFGFSFNHTKRVERHDAPRQNYPTQLPASVVDLKTVLSNAMNQSNDSLSQFTPLANDWIATREMNK